MHAPSVLSYWEVGMHVCRACPSSLEAAIHLHLGGPARTRLTQGQALSAGAARQLSGACMHPSET